MRSFECLLSSEARLALIEAILDQRQRLSIRRSTKSDHLMCEDWHIGSWLRGEGLDMFPDEAERAWRTFFGFGTRALISQIISDRDDCTWIWPEDGFKMEDIAR